MALVVEDGTGVAGANTYAGVDDLKAYAEARGVALPTSDSELETALIRAMDFIESHRDRFQGRKAKAENPLQWPRVGVILDGFPVDVDTIPGILKDAQCQLAIDALEMDLQPTGTGREVISEKVDVIEVRYHPTGRGTVTPDFVKAMALLRPLFDKSGALRSIRL